MENIVIRKGRPEDGRDFAKLSMLTASDYFSEIFGENAESIIENSYRYGNNIFSRQYSYFMEIDGKIAGMTSFYEHDEKNSGLLFFVMLLIRYMKFKFLLYIGRLLKVRKIFARTRKGDMYSAGSAMYPEFRGRGLGDRLFRLSELAARDRGLKRVVVDVKSDNIPALSLRKKIGYVIEEKLPAVKLNGKRFEYLKLVKNLN